MKKINLLVIALTLVMISLPILTSAKVTIDPGDFAIIPEPVDCNDSDADGPACATSAYEVIFGVINIILGIVALIAVLFVIIGGFRYVTAAGNEETAAAAKKTILHAVIGLIVVIMSFAIIIAVSTWLITGEI